MSKKDEGKSLTIVVQTLGHDPETGEKLVIIEKEKEIDQYNAKDRRWLARHCWWAMHNDKGIITFPRSVE